MAFELEAADRLSIGLGRLANGEIGVILLGLLLPDSQGVDTFTRVHNEVPEGPIVVLSAIADETLIRDEDKRALRTISGQAVAALETRAEAFEAFFAALDSEDLRAGSPLPIL